MVLMHRWCGAVAQLGERVVRNDEVSGSIPLSSTTIPPLILPALSSSPLSAGALTLGTRRSVLGARRAVDARSRAGTPARSMR